MGESRIVLIFERGQVHVMKFSEYRYERPDVKAFEAKVQEQYWNRSIRLAATMSRITR